MGLSGIAPGRVTAKSVEGEFEHRGGERGLSRFLGAQLLMSEGSALRDRCAPVWKWRDLPQDPPQRLWAMTRIDSEQIGACVLRGCYRGLSLKLARRERP